IDYIYQNLTSFFSLLSPSPLHPIPPSFLSRLATDRNLHSFPTRRSSDLNEQRLLAFGARPLARPKGQNRTPEAIVIHIEFSDPRSESTRLNSSHSQISYAVFCLKKKKKNIKIKS